MACKPQAHFLIKVDEFLTLRVEVLKHAPNLGIEKMLNDTCHVPRFPKARSDRLLDVRTASHVTTKHGLSSLAGTLQHATGKL